MRNLELLLSEAKNNIQSKNPLCDDHQEDPIKMI